MPEWVWIPITVVGTGVIIAIVLMMWKRGGTLGIGKNTFVLHGDAKNPKNPLAKALRYVPENIGQVTSLVYSGYLKIVKSKGVEPAVMTDIEDSKFARSVIRNATSLGNGSNSVQKIIENDIANRDYVGHDIEQYVHDIVLPKVVDSIRNTINSEYDTVARYAEHSDRQRIVTQAEFVDMLSEPRFQHDLAHAILPFYRFAARCLSDGCVDI
jgi:hypothetical protein